MERIGIDSLCTHNKKLALPLRSVGSFINLFLLNEFAILIENKDLQGVDIPLYGIKRSTSFYPLRILTREAQGKSYTL